MFIWCVILFGLGVLAFLDSMYSYGEVFQRVNAVMFMMVSLGMLVRTRLLMQAKRYEKLVEENELYKRQLNQTRQQAPAEEEQQKEPELVG